MLFSDKFSFPLEVKYQKALCSVSSGVGTLPCIPDGGSPSWYHDYPRITDAIFTGQHLAIYSTCGLTSTKSSCYRWQVLRRVDYLSTKDSSKGYSATPLSSFFSSVSILFPLYLAQLSLSSLRQFFASRSWSVRHV